MYQIITISKISRIFFSKITRYATKEEDHRKLKKLKQQNGNLKCCQGELGKIQQLLMITAKITYEKIETEEPQ